MRLVPMPTSSIWPFDNSPVSWWNSISRLLSGEWIAYVHWCVLLCRYAVVARQSGSSEHSFQVDGHSRRSIHWFDVPLCLDNGGSKKHTTVFCRSFIALFYSGLSRTYTLSHHCTSLYFHLLLELSTIQLRARIQPLLIAAQSRLCISPCKVRRMYMNSMRNRFVSLCGMFVSWARFDSTKLATNYACNVRDQVLHQYKTSCSQF
jgi:hypothetical protein